MLASAALRSPRPRRPDELRLGLRLAAGVGVGKAAAAEGVAEAEVEALLASPDFAGLVEDCRAIRDLPRDARLARLEALALDMLELAMTRGDTRAIVFFLGERRAFRDPARTLALGALAAERRAAAARPRPEPRPRPPAPPRPTPLDPERSAAALARRLRRAVLAEERLHAPARVAARPEQPAAERPAAISPSPPRRPVLRVVASREEGADPPGGRPPYPAEGP
jgi:hypothetical protein